MESRIQFRVDEETKQLAQQMAERQGRTLSDACREFTEQLANAQRKALSYDAWLADQVNTAFERYENSDAEFVDQDTAKAQMEEFKSHIRSEHKK